MFEGQFSIESNKEELVTSALGLYSLILKNRHLPHIRAIYEQVADSGETTRGVPRGGRGGP